MLKENHGSTSHLSIEIGRAAVLPHNVEAHKALGKIQEAGGGRERSLQKFKRAVRHSSMFEFLV